jgi:hypothetical protein
MRYTATTDMFTHTTTSHPVATLDEITIALEKVDAMLIDQKVTDPAIVGLMFNTLFPYVLNAVMTYDEDDHDA